MRKSFRGTIGGAYWAKMLAAASLGISCVVNATAISAGSAGVNIGDTFVIPISVSGVVDLQSYQFDLAFDPSLLQANLVTEGPFLSSGGAKLTVFTPGAIDNTLGTISLVAGAYADILPYPSGDGVIAEIEFTALANGLSALTLSSPILNFADSFEAVNNGAVRVPEPGTVPLLAGALLMLTSLQRIRGAMRGNRDVLDVL